MMGRAVRLILSNRPNADRKLADVPCRSPYLLHRVQDGSWGFRMYRVTPILVVVVCGVLLWLSFEYIDGGVWQARHVVGLAIVVPSLMLWSLARNQLGGAFTARAEARSLVTRGLYAKIRHPIYIFAELLSVGIFLFLGRPWFFALLLISVPLQVRRARREDRILEEAFGQEYQAYRKQTWF
jgi:protein-S-isoprenylcysteine O-methyltransferase Ste14